MNILCMDINTFTDKLNSLFKGRELFTNNSLKSLYTKIETLAEKIVQEIKDKQSVQENKSYDLLREIKVLEERKNEIDLKISKISSEIEKLLNDE
ncbi:hypothetical protein H311_02345 [Anncaliia algerae PRA109]|nr:hypothetical protein H311_02345 [Anncaliia algerae PRA109]